MAAHSLLLAGILVLLPDGMPGAGPSVAGVEVELLPPVQPVRESRDASLLIPQTSVAAAPPVSAERSPGEAGALFVSSRKIVGRAPENKHENKQMRLEDKASIEIRKPDLKDVDLASWNSDPTRPEADVGEREKERNHTVRQRLETFKHYPASARRRGIEGAVDVSFRLNAEGRAEDMQLVSGSGYAILDDAALSTVRRAEPFPVRQGSYRFRLRFTRS